MGGSQRKYGVGGRGFVSPRDWPRRGSGSFFLVGGMQSLRVPLVVTAAMSGDEFGGDW
jgi:hypothetical protein